MNFFTWIKKVFHGFVRYLAQNKVESVDAYLEHGECFEEDDVMQKVDTYYDEDIRPKHFKI